MTEISSLVCGGGVIVNKCISNLSGIEKDIFLFDVKEIMKHESSYFPMPGGEFEFGQHMVTTSYYIGDLEAKTTHNNYEIDCFWKDKNNLYHWDTFQQIYVDQNMDTTKYLDWYCKGEGHNEFWVKTKPKRFVFKMAITTPLYQGIENIIL